MELILKRILYTDDGILGVLSFNNHVICMTLEEEWKDNKKNESAIPEGSYLCSKVFRKDGTETYEVTKVPGRSSILIHPGNTEADTQGCILVGTDVSLIDTIDEESGKIEKQLAVINSKEAFSNFLKLVNNRSTFVLHVRRLL